MSNKIFYCTHAKGGAGTSLFSTNFAYALSKQLKNKKVLFLDANQSSDIAHLFGINAKKDVLNFNMFLKEQDDKTLNKKNIQEIFNQTAYQINKLDILLSPKNYYAINDLNIIYKIALKQALKIYDYIVIDTEKNNELLLQDSLPTLHSLMITTTIDNLATTKTLSFLKTLNNKNINKKIKIICNQIGTFSQKDLEKIFDFPIACTLPTEINGAWDNILLGVPIIENKKLAYSRQINKFIQNLFDTQ